jgi:hypothetical protein
MIRGTLKGSLPLSGVEEDPKLHKLSSSRTSQRPALSGGPASPFRIQLGRTPTETLVPPFSFFLFPFIQFFYFSKTKNGEFFFLLKKAHFICIGKKNPLPPPFFSIKFFFSFVKKTFMLENH